MPSVPYHQDMKLLALLLMAALVPPAMADGERGGRDRLAPPAALDCDRNHLTSYEGRLRALTPGPDTITVTLVTDWGSEETFAVPSDSVQLRDGQPMDPTSLAEFLATLEPPTTVPRLIAWVCSEPCAVTLDWRPTAD